MKLLAKFLFKLFFRRQLADLTPEQRRLVLCVERVK